MSAAPIGPPRVHYDFDGLCGAYDYFRACRYPATFWLGPVPLCKEHYEHARIAQERHRNITTWVYFARIGDYIKIGQSRNPTERARVIHLSKGLLRPDDLPRGQLTLLHAEPATPVLERVLHEAFDEARVVGEWFRASPRLVGYIASLQASSAGREQVPA